MKIKHEQLEKEARMLEDQLENEFEKLKVAYADKAEASNNLMDERKKN